MIREGLIPIVAGTVATSVGAVMRGMDMKKKQGMPKEEIMPMIGAGIVGFGLAHIVLGTIDLNQKRHGHHWRHMFQ
jgi:hypothetical protein